MRKTRKGLNDLKQPFRKRKNKNCRGRYFVPVFRQEITYDTNMENLSTQFGA